jgi:hypothetical protein
MTRRCSLGLACLMIAAVAAPASADQTGLAAMHDMARVGGKMCMTDHTHYGSGQGANKAAAQKDAIGSWQSFTEFEYGSDWARFSKAVGKRISCSQSGSGVDCQVEARPCR